MFTVYVDDNFHYVDESENYKLGEFKTYEAALEVSKKIVDSSLSEHHRNGMTAQELFDQYMTFGEDPHIISDDGTLGFSAWSYAEEQCKKICQE